MLHMTESLKLTLRLASITGPTMVIYNASARVRGPFLDPDAIAQTYLQIHD